MTQPDREAVIERLARNPHLAHATFFRHRHPDETPDFHQEIISLWHGPDERVLIEAFRGAAKSTLAEEAITIMAGFRKFKNGLVLGETFERAVERLKSIKHELEENPFLEEVFGSLVGATWTEARIVLANGVCIQAVGRGQSLRGVKHLDARPDIAFGDDIENEDSVKTPEARAATMQWLMAVVTPALEPHHKIRINGTPLDPQSMVCQLAVDPDWVARKYPIKYKDEGGDWVPTWPARFPLEWSDKKEAGYIRLGISQTWKQEFMCEAEDPAVKAFTADVIKVVPTVRSWHLTYAMYDPARTVKTTSATTGKVVFSWIANKLVVWDSAGEKWKPDEIIADMFKVDDEFQPVTIGVERDGLEEFILQPLRQEQLRRAYSIPIRPMKAPKGKLDFIRSLQPFFKATEIEFAKDMPALKTQLLGFPTGLIDIPNALAYAMILRPGQPIYDNFGNANVAEELYKLVRQPMFLAVNATTLFTTAALVQMVDGALHVHWDAVREGDPGSTLAAIVADAGIEAGQRPKLYAPPEHFGNHDTIGLRGAARKVPVDLGQAGLTLDGREELRELLRRTVKQMPALRIARKARWTLNGFGGGYCKEVLKNGMLSEFPADGPYKTLLEGLESFAALMRMGNFADDTPPNYAYTRTGQRYLTSMPGRGARG